MVESLANGRESEVGLLSVRCVHEEELLHSHNYGGSPDEATSLRA